MYISADISVYKMYISAEFTSTTLFLINLLANFNLKLCFQLFRDKSRILSGSTPHSETK